MLYEVITLGGYAKANSKVSERRHKEWALRHHVMPLLGDRPLALIAPITASYGDFGGPVKPMPNSASTMPAKPPSVITSYSIHYTKLYEAGPAASARTHANSAAEKPLSLRNIDLSDRLIFPALIRRRRE